MGLSCGPYVFSCISGFMVHCLLREGCFRCVNYLDDFYVIGKSQNDCEFAQKTLITVLCRAGFYINFKKISPASKITRFLGIYIDGYVLPANSMAYVKL